MQIRKGIFAFAVIAAVFLTAGGQVLIGHTPPAGEARDLSLSSRLMGREMSYRVILPLGYSDPRNRDANFPVVYLLHGYAGHYGNWTDKTELRTYARLFQLIIVTPEGDNGWYTDSVTKPTDKYESYIVSELIPEIDKNFRTARTRENRFVAGLSMGGYGAVKFGLKYPETFAIAGSFSGALRTTEFTAGNAGAIGTSVDEVFGPAGSETRKANDIFRIVRELSPDRLKLIPYLYVSCGTEDFLFQSNRDFAAVLVDKKISHEYRQLPGGHTWKFWDEQVREFLGVVNRRLPK